MEELMSISEEFLFPSSPENQSQRFTSESDHDEFNRPWGMVVLGTMLVNIVSLSGILFLIPTLSRRRKTRGTSWCTSFFWNSTPECHCSTCDATPTTTPTTTNTENNLALTASVPTDDDNNDETEDSVSSNKIIDIIIPSFAAGALLSTAFFLVLPEALSLITSGLADPHADEHADETEEEHAEHEDEEDLIPVSTIWRYGLAVLSGFLLPMAIGALFPRSLEHECDDECGAAPAVVRTSTENQNDTIPFLPNNANTNAIDTATVIAVDQPIKEDVHVADIEAAEHKTNSHTHSHNDSHCSHDHDHSHSHSHDHSPRISKSGNGTAMTEDTSNNLDVEITTTTEPPASGPTKIRSTVNKQLCASILIGDGLHNFCDGVFIGAAFSSCDYRTAFTIIGITIYHEIAQELADYFLLTRHAGLPPIKALIVNFMSGLFVLLGGILVLAIPQLTSTCIGVILSIAAGVYMHIAACECLPRIEDLLQTTKDRFISLSVFILGCVPIGLTLLNHRHCGEH